MKGKPSEECLIGILEMGCSPAEAVDHWATEVKGIGVSEWADKRGVSRQIVSRHRKAVKDTLDGNPHSLDHCDST